MKKSKKLFLIILLLFLPALASAQQAKQASALLQEGRYAEDIDGNLDKAISLYEQVIKDTSADDATKAQAMFQQGLCLIKKQEESKAQEVLSRLVEQFPRQTKLVEKARVILTELTDSDPAALMPPETLVYVELGSPGKQVETILNMLKGTPFENPLAAIAGQGGPPPGQQSPAQVLNALFNPSMMAEFKKIRGMAVGVTEIKNNPSLVAVLYPGKSDAFRGLIMAGLGMAGQPAAAIEDMNVLNIQNTAGAAYDDTVIIVAQPMEQLKKCIAQYKRKAGGPNLAENNKSFAEIGKKNRSENALTIWVNVDQAYEAVKKQMGSNVPEEMTLAETFVDPQNIDELLATLSIDNDAINFDAKINFKPGYQGITYSLFRTPSLTKEGFAYIPSDSAAVLSFALNPAAAEKIQKPLESITGLDFGREIFDNIEQINVFIIPADFAKNNAQGPAALAQCLGIAITSRNPAQTQQILKKILGTVNTVGQFFSGQANTPQPETNQYLLLSDGKEKLYCCLGQSGNASILTFSPESLRSALAAQDKSNSILTAGPLSGPIGQLSPGTSKLILLNAGGLIKIAEASLKIQHDNPDNPAYKQLEQIAALFEKTNVQIRISEKADSLGIHAGIEGIPPMKDIFPLVQQLRQANPQAKTTATNPRPADMSAVPVTDAGIRLQWSPGVAAVSHKVYVGNDPAKLTLLTETKDKYVSFNALEDAAGYYWRVDEVWADGTVKTGNLWRFYTGGLVAHWKLDETEGSVAKDSSKHKFDASVKGNPQWQSSGKVDGALSFDGVDDYIELPEAINQFNGGLTAILWAKPAGNETWARFFEFGNGEQSDNIILSRLENSNNLMFAIHYGNEWQERVIAQNAIELDNWQCFAVTVDRQGNTVLYKNGRRIQAGKTSEIRDVARKQLYIGKSQWPNDQLYKGLIDDFRLYNYVLSDQEIANIYQGSPNIKGQEPAPTTSITQTGLVGWWKFDGDAKDSSGKGNDGTAVNGPQWVAGKINGAIRLDGEDDHVSLPIGRLISTLQSSTLAIWVDFSNEGGTWQRILDFGTDTDNYICLLPRMEADGPLHVGIAAGEGERTELDAQTGTLPTGWHHIAVVLEPGNLRLYLDGVATGNITTLYVLSDLGETTNNWLGRSQYPSDAYFNGALDDFRIYNYALSDNEIAGLYKSAFNSNAGVSESK